MDIHVCTYCNSHHACLYGLLLIELEDSPGDIVMEKTFVLLIFSVNRNSENEGFCFFLKQKQHVILSLT